MASFNLRIPDELVTGKASTEAQVRSMRKYLYRLNDELAYLFSTIDLNNMTEVTRNIILKGENNNGNQQ